MNLVADENIDRQIVERLRFDGHDVWSIAEMDPGISDEEVLEVASRESAVLMTADRDFGELVSQTIRKHNTYATLRYWVTSTWRCIFLASSTILSTLLAASSESHSFPHNEQSVAGTFLITTRVFSMSAVNVVVPFFFSLPQSGQIFSDELIVFSWF